MEMKFTTNQYLPRTFVLLAPNFLDHKVRFHTAVKQSTYPFLRHTYLLLSHLQEMLNFSVQHVSKRVENSECSTKK